MAVSMVIVSSCDLDQYLDDPNAVTRDTASPTLILTRVQVDLADLFDDLSFLGMQLTRIVNQDAEFYEQAYIPTAFNVIWQTSYSDILNDIRLLEPLAEEGGFRKHLGIARVIKAYVMMTLVDHFGEVPYSEALDPTNLNPLVDPGAAVYDEALAILQDAKADFASGTPDPVDPVDFFYGGDEEKWLRLINTLELKYHLNRKLVDAAGSTTAINALIADNNFIQPGDEWVFPYGRSQNDPDARHPRFQITYTNGGGNYQSTWYMWHLTENKGFDDPRARYYLYRQVTQNTTDPDELRCISEFPPAHYLSGGFPFCLPGERGYWGRDHLNDEGIPPDGLSRTVYGLYPAGGRYDDSSGEPVNDPALGNQGAGIAPIMLPAFVDFMLAEAAQTLGTSGDAKAYLLSGIEKHMNYVRDFAMNSLEAGAIAAFEASEEIDFEEQVADYVDYVSAEYDEAPANRKMYVIGLEYWLSLYGSGIEAYNLYRRTGQPAGMQPGLLENAGDFPRSFLYPNDFITTNSNAQQRELRRRVFWDTNPEGNTWVY